MSKNSGSLRNRLGVKRNKQFRGLVKKFNRRNAVSETSMESAFKKAGIEDNKL